MRNLRIAMPAVLAAGLAVLPLSGASAQYYGQPYYGPPCTPFPLTWPFCVAGAVVGTAAAVVSAPFRPYYYYPQRYYAPPPPYYPPPYYPPR
jgi:hypothetical protein